VGAGAADFPDITADLTRPHQERTIPMTDLITRADLKAKLERGDDFVLIDTLPATAYRNGHLPGAINIVSDDILAEAPTRIPDRDADIVVYCGNGPCKRSSLSADRLRTLGYRKVRDYHEGKADWIAAGFPVETK